MSDVATKDYVDKLVEAQEATLQALTSATITAGSEGTPQSLMHITVLRLDQAHKAAIREVDEYRTAIMHLEERIQRLEEAGDAMASILNNARKDWYTSDQCEVTAFNWNEAKEAKP